MARQTWGLLWITLACFLAGCNEGDRYEPPVTGTTLSDVGIIDLSATTEIDLVEQVAVNRENYIQSLELLVDYYARTGNNTRLGQSQKELRSLKTMTHYTYIPDAVVPDASLKATMSIPEADALYLDAEQLRSDASTLGIKNKNTIRLALDMYMQLISRYQNSDKIDDAAFQIAEIHKGFKDYNTALLYYQRAYQWNPSTPYPARFQAAKVLDDYLARKDEAVELYQEAIRLEGTRYAQWKSFAEERIAELTNTAEDD